MAAITTDTYLTGSALAEIFTISNGATLYIDPQYFTAPVQPFGRIECFTKGRLQITNTSSAQIFTMSMASPNNDFRFETKGEFFISGSMVEIYTGDGTANQTINFNSIGGVAIDFPSCVWVQSGSDGPLIPFQNLGSTVSGSEYFYMPLSGALSPAGQGQGVGSGSFGGVIGTWEGGRYFNFNSGSGIAIFGDGTYGAVIPNGFKVYYPNIHITSQPTASLISKTTIDFSPTGLLDFKNVGFSREIYFPNAQSNALSCYLENVSLTNTFGMIQTAGAVTLKNVSIGPGTDANPGLAPIAINNITGDVIIDGLYITHAMDRVGSTAVGSMISIGIFPSIKQFDNLYLNFINKLNSGAGGNNAAGHTIGSITNITNLTANNWTLIGGVTALGPLNNFKIVGLKHSSTPFAPSGSLPIVKWQQAIINTNNASNVTFGKVRLLDGGIPSYNVPIIFDNTTNDNINYIDWDYNTSYLGTAYNERVISMQGTNQTMANCVFGRVRSLNGFWGSGVGVVTTANIKIDNVRGPFDTINRQTSGLVTQNMLASTISDPGIGGGFNINPYGLLYVDSNQVTGTQGRICIGPFSPESSQDYFTTNNTSSVYFNNGGRIFIDSSGNYAEFTTIESMRGITSFPSIGPIRYLTNAGLSTTNSGSFNYSFEMQPYGTPFTGSLLPLTITNVSSSFATISSSGAYNSNQGLIMKTRLTATSTAIFTNYVQRIDISCSVDPNYQAADSSIIFAGGSNTDKYEMVKYSDDSLLFTFIGVGINFFPTTGLLGTQVYIRRYVKIDGDYIDVINSKANPTIISLGDNGTVNLYAGNEVQVASSDPSTIWNYTTRTLTDGTFTNADRTQLNKTLTTSKFIALK